MENLFSITELATIILEEIKNKHDWKIVRFEETISAYPITSWSALRETSILLRDAVDQVSRAKVAEMVAMSEDSIVLQNSFGLYRHFFAVPNIVNYYLCSNPPPDDESLAWGYYLDAAIQGRSFEIISHLLSKLPFMPSLWLGISSELRERFLDIIPFLPTEERKIALGFCESSNKIAQRFFWERVGL